MEAKSMQDRPVPREGTIPVGNVELYYREIGQGEPVIILHGGPDFDCNYLFPEMDRLSDSFRLIYYDQRGRGRSARNVQPEDISIQSDVEDIESVRKYFGFETTAILGHSWGVLLALEFAIRYPDRVSYLILMNSAPVSSEDFQYFRQERLKSAAATIEELKAKAAGEAFQEGDREAVADYYRVHFRETVMQPDLREKLIENLCSSLTKEGVVKAREIENRLMKETWLSGEYDLLPKLRPLRIPALVIHGDTDLVPVECAIHIVQAIPGARFVYLGECGHFSFLERPDEVQKEVEELFRGD